MNAQAGTVLDVSKVASPHSFHGLELAVRSFGGARALRIVHPAHQRIPEHRHDWPLLTLPALGGYVEDCGDGTVSVGGPAAVLHPSGRCHANCIHAAGMETFSIEFDPAWLGLSRLAIHRSFYWLGGEVPLASRALVRLWNDASASETLLRRATAEFVTRAMVAPAKARPAWLTEVQAEIACGERLTASTLAAQVGLHPRWLAHAYRSAVGEGLHETLRRRQLEHAAHLLRTTDQPIAGIAAEAGFCDQSHLNRALMRAVGRTPARVRAEGDALRALAG